MLLIDPRDYNTALHVTRDVPTAPNGHCSSVLIKDKKNWTVSYQSNGIKDPYKPKRGSL